MARARADEQAWLAATVRALNANGSWSGRIHAHKLLFISKTLGLTKPPFNFQLYDYGPYSFRLDQEFTFREAVGLLTREYPQPGYGPKYQLTSLGNRIADTLDQPSRDGLARTAKALGSRTSKELELLATCLWVERREKTHNDDSIVQRVLTLKPRYSEEDVRGALVQLRQLAQKLSATR